MPKIIDRVYSPEVAEKLKGFLPMAPRSDFPYVPLVYRESVEDKDLWPVFILKGHDGIQAAKMEDEVFTAHIEEVGGDRSIKTHSGKIRLEYLRRNLVNIKNWIDLETGKVIKFERNVRTNQVDDKVLGKISTDLQIELVDAITERSTLSDEEIQGLKY